MRMRMRESIIRALADEMEADSTVITMGEDIAVGGGVFKTTVGLLDRFGPRRVYDTPISEMGFVGAAVGAAATGLKPVVEIMFVEFMGVALDQLTTQAAKVRYLSRGAYTAPLTIRTSAGAGMGYGCQHSQVLDQWFRGTAGLKVVMPSTPQNAYGLLRAAIQDPDPVIVLEPRPLYGNRGDVVVGDEGIVPLGQARTVRSGDEITIVAAGATVPVAIEATDRAGWSADLIDLQTLAPWDRDAVFASVARTGRLVIVEESPESGGWGSAIAHEVAAEFFGRLQVPPHRVTTPDVPVPYSGPLEERFLPSADYVVSQVEELMSTGRRPAPWWEKGVGA